MATAVAAPTPALKVPKSELPATVPRFTVDLDLPASQRWTHIIAIYKDTLVSILSQIEALIDQQDSTAISAGTSVASGILNAMTTLSVVKYGDELCAIAAQTGLPVGKLVAMQLVYEAAAHCTSIVTSRAVDSKVDDVAPPMHCRTMDWEMDFLRPLTVEVEFIHSKATPSTTSFIATTWVGYVGVLTGMSRNRTENFSVSINFRPAGTGTYWTNLKAAVLDHSWPVGFLVRQVLTDAKTYDEAKGNFTHSELIAPTYITLCGAQAGHGCVITRDRKTADDVWELASKGDVSQCNMDLVGKSDDCFNSKQRSQTGLTKVAFVKGKASRRPPPSARQQQEPSAAAAAASKAKAQPAEDDAPIDLLPDADKANHDIDPQTALAIPCKGPCLEPEDLWEVIHTQPVRNDLTVYGVVMDPFVGYYQTRLPTTEGFIPSGRRQDVSTTKFKKCKNCDQIFDPALNAPGQCAHTGKWHGKYDDCSYLKCGYNLGIAGKIGKAHWGCCYSTSQKSLCPKAGAHQE